MNQADTLLCPPGMRLRFGRELHPGQGGADITGEQQTQAADLRLEIFFHPVFEPFVKKYP